MPRVVLPADSPEGSDWLEPHGVVQADAPVVWQRHARDRGAKAALGQTKKERVVERTAAASTASATLEVNADLARPSICLARLTRVTADSQRDVKERSAVRGSASTREVSAKKLKLESSHDNKANPRSRCR